MKKSTLIAAMLTVSSLSVASAAIAQVEQVDEITSQRSMAAKYPARMHSQRHSFIDMFESIELSTAQQQKIKTLIQQHKADRKKHLASTQQHREIKAAMTQLMQAEYFDEAQAEQLIHQRQQHHQSRQLQRLKLRYNLLQVLTPEQRQQLAEANKNQPKRQHVR
jgi:Spy/CpxP family protein refolding chaperone